MPHLESPESSSPIITRAVAAGLAGQYSNSFEFPGWQKTVLSLLSILPQSVARFAISRFMTISGLPPRLLDNFSVDNLINERLADYASLSGRYPAILLGASLSGATSYLSLSLGGPFLPQAFVITLKGGSSDGDVNKYLDRSQAASLHLAAADPRIMTIQHYDPVHDNWLTRFVNFIRFKLIDLPSAYKDFISSRLQPGGELVYLEGGAQWLRYRLGPRSIFQVGGWGDISPEEFLEGSNRLRIFSRKNGLKYTDWRLSGYPLERGPESEWGSEPGLAEALEAFCQQEGYRFIRIRLSEPTDFSRLAFASAQKLLEKEGRQPAGVLVESFTQFDPLAARLGSLLPLWLIFNTLDSARFLEKMTTKFPQEKPVFFSPLSTFTLTPDMVPWQGWSKALGRTDWINIGARRSHYPADTRALMKWAEPMRAWVARNPQPIQAHLSGEELLALSQELD